MRADSKRRKGVSNPPASTAFNLNLDQMSVMLPSNNRNDAVPDTAPNRDIELRRLGGDRKFLSPCVTLDLARDSMTIKPPLSPVLTQFKTEILGGKVVVGESLSPPLRTIGCISASSVELTTVEIV
jgi:hypothetical protein